MELYCLPKPLLKANVLSRPSKKIKSPYLADIEIDGKEILCHTAALGCCGHIKTGAIVWVLEKPASKAQSTHEVYLVEIDGQLVGCHPLIANKIGASLLKSQKILPIGEIIQEVKFDTCRFDFTSIDKKTIIEVKSVPMADHYDGTLKELNAYIKGRDLDNNSKVAIFPFGKRKVELLSPRALKHVESLTKLVTDHTCVLLFIIQRTDIDRFTITKLDPIYKAAVGLAKEAGVLIKAVSVRWDNQRVYFEKELPIIY